MARDKVAKSAQPRISAICKPREIDELRPALNRIMKTADTVKDVNMSAAGKSEHTSRLGFQANSGLRKTLPLKKGMIKNKDMTASRNSKTSANSSRIARRLGKLFIVKSEPSVNIDGTFGKELVQCSKKRSRIGTWPLIRRRETPPHNRLRIRKTRRNRRG